MHNAPEPAFASLVDLLEWRADHQPDGIAYNFRDIDGDTTITYRELALRARSVAHDLLRYGVPGDRALLLFPPGLDFIGALFGCLHAGFIAIPAYPPRASRSLARLERIASDSAAVVALTTDAMMRGPGMAEAASIDIVWRAVESAANRDAVDRPDIIVESNSPALLQYTSGSTGAPRGVIVSHRNLLHNSMHIGRLFEHHAESRAVVWLPFYHDMGLIGGVIQPLYAGFPMTLMSPMSFLQSPFRWLRVISETGATISGGPNFAYDLCVQRVTEAQRAQLDLSSWQVAFNGAEPIRPETLARFTEYFAPCGFRREAFYPCYGLAEATLMVSGGAKRQPPVMAALDRPALEHGTVTLTTDAPRILVGSGQALPDQTVCIVDPRTGEPCGPEAVGEIWVAGPSVAQGYWNRPEETAEIFGARLASGHGPFLRTGDLGFVRDGELFVTGRIKDLVIIRGRNHYPQDIESSVEHAHPALRPHAGVAFSVDIDGEERLVVTHEADRKMAGSALEEIAAAIRQAVGDGHELQVHEVVLVRAGTLPRTTSGKLQRRLCRQRYLAGELDVVASSVLADAAGPAGPVPGRDEILAAQPVCRRALLDTYLRLRAASALRLDVASVNPERPLNELGVDSLAAIQFQHAVEIDLGVVLSAADLLNGASLDELSAHLTEALDAPMAEPLTAASPAARADARYPLSAGQRSMWFLHRMAPESSAYIITCALRITAEVDVSALERAFEKLIDRHAVLRTRYATAYGEPVQVVGARPDGWFYRRDAAGWDDYQLAARLSAEAQRPFDLSRGPVIRVELFSRDTRDHVLLLAIHHVAADFWSVEILLSELGQLYGGGQAELDGLPIQYSDYAAWQDRMLSGPEGDRLWTYWQRTLSGGLPELQLPADRPRPPVQTYCGDIHRFTVEPALTGALRDLAERYGTTLYTVLLAGFGVLLHRYSGQTDIIVGSPMVARGRVAFAGMVGYLSNTLPLRLDLSGDPSFGDLLRRARGIVVQALQHQDFPFPAMVERFGGMRDSSRPPVFQVAFTFQQTHLTGRSELAALAFGGPGLRGQLGDLPVESVPLPRQAAPFDISLHIAETDSGMAASLTYNTDLFDGETMGRMAGHLRTLLTAAAAGSTSRISALPMLTGAEVGGLRPAFAGRADGQYAHRLIEAQVARTPDAVAIIGGPRSLKYRELNDTANRLARHLRAFGTGQEGLVGIMLEPGIRYIVAVLAVLKAGAAYLPLDPAYPADRLAFMLDDARIRVLLTQESLRAAIPANAAATVYLDSVDLDSYPSGDLPDPATAPDLACVIYTSGSTGQPKGVMLTHAGLVTQVRALSGAFAISGADRHLLAQSMAFAASLRQLTVPLSAGAAVVVATPDEVADIPALFGLIKRHDVSIVSLNPSFWRHCMEVLARLSPQQRAVLLDNRLRLLLSASEPLPPEIPRWWLAELGARVRFVNMLGHTEVSGIASTYPVPREGTDGYATVPAGAPLPGIEVYILNESLQPVPPGVSGEMYLGGPAVTRGYLNRPELTAQRLLPNPYACIAGDRLYRTGDLVRLLRNGVIEHLGRVDDQLKIRGFRIEPAEVESALLKHPGIRASVVVAGADGGSERRLVAYVVPADETSPTISDLRRHLKARLPGYLVPSLFVVMDALPLNANGKLDRRALPAPAEARPDLDDEFAPPSSALEETLTGIWAEVLTMDQVGIHDSFFDLGGTSLSLTKAHQLLCERLEIELPIVKLFQYPTVHAIAQYLSETEPTVSKQVERGRATASRRRQLLDSGRARRRGGAQ